MILRDINVPELRWRYKQGDIDLRLPVHQYLYTQNWSSGTYVQKVLQRLHTMKIIPDSLPTLAPKVEVRLRWRESGTARGVPSRVVVRRRGWRDVEAGEKLSSKTLMGPPRMEIIPHHREWWVPKKYTVVMLDLGTYPRQNETPTSSFVGLSLGLVSSSVDGRCSGCGERLVQVEVTLDDKRYRCVPRQHDYSKGQWRDGGRLASSSPLQRNEVPSLSNLCIRTTLRRMARLPNPSLPSPQSTSHSTTTTTTTTLISRHNHHRSPRTTHHRLQNRNNPNASPPLPLRLLCPRNSPTNLRHKHQIQIRLVQSRPGHI